MQLIKRFISVTIISGLLSGLATTAQPADLPKDAATNSPGAAVVEDPGGGSNATALATNESEALQKGAGVLNREAMVVMGKDAELKAGDSAKVVVAIGGS